MPRAEYQPRPGASTIEDQGSFFIGGVSKVTEHSARPPSGPGVVAAAQPFVPSPQQITIGQMYVQFQIPAKKSGPGWPVIMVHGSSHTAACLESTPDGREGWYPYFVRKGISTYVVDQAGRGRSGFDHSVLHEAEARLESGDAKAAAELMPTFGRITDNGAWTAWFGHLVPDKATILSGTLVLHGDPRDPTPNPDAFRRVKLDEMGMLGVTHMMMLDQRNLEIADVILNWVNRNVPKAGRRTATK